jgi:hypothetical protein
VAIPPVVKAVEETAFCQGVSSIIGFSSFIACTTMSLSSKHDVTDVRVLGLMQLD